MKQALMTFLKYHHLPINEAGGELKGKPRCGVNDLPFTIREKETFKVIFSAS